MFKFFTKIRYNLMEKGNTGRYLKYGLGEIILVVIGILIALQLNSWKETNTEKKLVKQYISGLIEDLESDTSSINALLELRKNKALKMDSLMQLLKSQKIKGNENDLYFFSRILIRSRAFQSNDRTLVQLKNSASLRLIRNTEVTNRMMEYQNLVDLIYRNQRDEQVERREALPIIFQIFNAFIFDEMVTIDTINRPINNPPLRSYDPSLHQDFAHWIHQTNGSDLLIINVLGLLNRKAVALIDILRKEYELY